MTCKLKAAGAKNDIRYGGLKMGAAAPDGRSIGFTNSFMTLNGLPFFSISGEFHFSRYNRENWEREILKIKACGLDAIATYLFWIHHEFYEGQFDFSGSNDIRAFLELCKKHGMTVILRIGPFSHGECRNGGLPDWLYGMPFEVRSNDAGYLFYVERYFREIGRQVEGLMFTQGGPVIAVQLENEYAAARAPWEATVPHCREWIPSGSGGLRHMLILRGLAEKAGLKSAFYTCTAWDGSPLIDGEILPLWGGYAYWPWLYWDAGNAAGHPPTGCYVFKNCRSENSGFDLRYPYACCEMGGGMQVWYNYRFAVEPESVEALCLVTVANGCNFLGYYMFHGGSNPVIGNTFMNEQLTPRISYDFQAPLGEFGLPAESYRRIKLLHYFLHDQSGFICRCAPVVPEGSENTDPSDTERLRYAARTDGKSGFLFINNYQDHIRQTDKAGIRFEVETDAGTISIPHRGSITVRRNVAAVIPFNLRLGGLTLEYSTSQLITEIAEENEHAYFFFNHEGINGEFCFSGSCRASSLSNVREEARDGRLFLYTGAGASSFSLTGPDGHAVRFIVLDRAQSLNFYKVRLAGNEYAVLSAANVFCTRDSLFFEVEDSAGPALTFMTYPGLPRTDGAEPVPLGESHFMHRYELLCSLPSPRFELRKYGENRAVIKFDASVLDEVDELFLNIGYTGDVGRAFINGRLVHDNFNNGTPWVIGLKRFGEELKKHDLCLCLSPVREPENVRFESSSTLTKVCVSENGGACFNSIRLVPQKTVAIHLAKSPQLGL